MDEEELDDRHQVRVERDGHTYRVQALKRTEPLGDVVLSGDLGGLVVEILARILWQVSVVPASRSWKVGVVVEPASRWGGERVLFKQRLPSDADVDQEVRRLANAVRAGDLGESVPRESRPTTYRSSRRKHPLLLRSR